MEWPVVEAKLGTSPAVLVWGPVKLGFRVLKWLGIVRCAAVGK
eukprot:COSAG04_NODE_1984_length_5075_cov_2.266077_4_plen_42_part_01